MFTPYPHQEYAVDQSWNILEQGKRPLIILPTGGGKTAVAAMLAHECSGRVIIICCFVALVEQFLQDLIMVGVPDADIGILQGDNSDRQKHLETCRVIIAMSQTLQSPRGAEFLARNRFDMSIADEKHLAHLDIGDNLVSATYQVGMTATPWRGDGDESLIDEYEWVQSKPLCELIREGKLIDYDHYFYPAELDEDATLEPDYVFNEWRNNLLGVPTLGFCKTIEEAKIYADFFGELGYPCAVACDDTPDDELREARYRFNFGQIHVIFSVTKIATGFNEPCAKGLLLCRRVKSVSLWVQIIGRILRRDGRNQRGILLDFFNNGLRLDNPLPDPRDIVDWKDIPGPSGKTCNRCGLKNSTKAIACKSCGHSLISEEEKRRIKRMVGCAINLDDYRRDRAMERSIRRAEVLDQVGVAKAAREAAFWEHNVDPVFAVKKQKELFPGVPPIVHSQILKGSIFGGNISPEDLAAYLAYLKPHAVKRADPDGWIVKEVRTEMGQYGIDLLKVACA